MKLVASLVLTFAVLVTHNADAQVPEPLETINPVVGDQSFVERFGRAPNASDSESLRITTHLAWVEAELRGADTDHLNDAQTEERARLLDALSDYRERGVFPINNEVAGRRPRFVDHEGTRCAVGHLLEVTEGQEAVMAINESHEWDLLLEMDAPALRAFANESGFTLVELAMIQPTYGWRDRGLTQGDLRRQTQQSVRRAVAQCDSVRWQRRRIRDRPTKPDMALVAPVPPPRPVVPPGARARIQRPPRTRPAPRRRMPPTAHVVTPANQENLVRILGVASGPYRRCLDQRITQDLTRRLARFQQERRLEVRVPITGRPPQTRELTQARLDQVADQIVTEIATCQTNVNQRVRVVVTATRARGVRALVQVRPARNRRCIETIANRRAASVNLLVARGLTSQRTVTIPAGAVAPPVPPVTSYSDARARAMIDGNAWAIRQCIQNQPGPVTLTVQVNVNGRMQLMGAALPPGLGNGGTLSCIATAVSRIGGADRPARTHTFTHDL